VVVPGRHAVSWFTGPAVEVGRPPPALVLPAEGGRAVDLKDFVGKPVLVSFLSHAA
jgi:hypothetical protein